MEQGPDGEKSPLSGNSKFHILQYLISVPLYFFNILKCYIDICKGGGGEGGKKKKKKIQKFSRFLRTI